MQQINLYYIKKEKLAAVRRNSKQSDTVYTALQVISHQIPQRGKVDKLRYKLNLLEKSLQQYESLTDGPSNQRLNNKNGAFDSRFVNNVQQIDSPFGEADSLDQQSEQQEA